MANKAARQASSRANASHQPFEESPTSQRFVIGKIDAGIAVLISDSVHLIEFPSLLLPAGVGPGSIVNIACTRNLPAEKQHARDFWDLQDSIASEFGAREPTAPKLRVRNTTQTSVTLEWDPLDLAAADLVNLSIYRNGQRLTTIPNPKSNTSTKLSGLQLDTDYAFHLVLKTTAGTYTSPVVKTRTHTIDNTTGISVCFGLVDPPKLADSAKKAVEQLGAKSDDRIQIDTTHFVATSSATRANPNGAPGPEYQKAIQLSIPVVTPEWLLACAQAKKLVPISAYYLGQTNRAASLSSAQLVQTPSSPSNAAPSSAALARVTEEEPPAAKPPVELEENVEAPPSEQTAAAAAIVAEPEPEPTEPVTVKISDADVSLPATTAGDAGREEEDEESSTRGIKSSEEGDQEDEQAAEAGAVEAQHLPAQEEEEDAAEETKPPSPPPTISVTPPVEEETSTTTTTATAATAPQPEGGLEEQDGEGAVSLEEAKEEQPEVETLEEKEETEGESAGTSKEVASGVEDALEQAGSKDGKDEKDEVPAGTGAEAGDSSLVDVKL
ncbi:hypothetical protein JCM10908_002856 [Rhodotorula pacifica]|uniref:uncharacterized protein n=1 Tax=Rhodotorula pacifica TaxID=1495444 RepID=UPI00317FABBF